MGLVAGVATAAFPILLDPDGNLRHAWLYTSTTVLRLEVLSINFLFGLVLYGALRIVFTPLAAMTSAAGLALTISLVSAAKMSALGLPALPWDLASLGHGSALVSFAGLDAFRPIVLFALGAIGLAGIIFRSQRLPRTRLEFSRSSALALAGVLLWSWAVVGDGASRLTVSGIHNLTWDQAANYSNYGPYYTFFANLRFSTLDAPSTSARRSAEALHAEYAEWRASAAPVADAPDIVLILSESLTDLPERIFGVPFSCLPQDRRAELLTPAWGGFTANVEFEVLSGYPHAIFPAGAVPYQMYMQAPVPHGLPWVFRARGYRTSAIHTYDRSFYERPRAYAALGFESYRAREDIRLPRYRGQYVSDETLFSEIERTLTSADGRPAFVHAVSMMAHMPYGEASVYAPRPEIKSRLPAQLAKHGPALLHYGSVIFDHEQMLCDFLARMRKRDRRTLVLIYGDHYPTFGDVAIYRDLHSVLAPPATPFDLVRQYSRTPVLVYDSKGGFVPLPATVAAYNLGALLLRLADLEVPGVWTLEHKRAQATIVDKTYVARQKDSFAVGSGVVPARRQEYEALAAHAFTVFIEGTPGADQSGALGHHPPTTRHTSSPPLLPSVLR